MKTIRITAEVKGGALKQEVKTEGFPGGECLRASAPFQANAGAVVTDEPTAEMTACEAQPVVEGGGS